ncbi:MAG: GlyGly-CTERM sorting domain-containing protein [Deltaproteobacteria bacterium]|nr:GlyGly-CTERM sorting domain-containing protein [Deltaproteobacteria bacterium]
MGPHRLALVALLLVPVVAAADEVPDEVAYCHGLREGARCNLRGRPGVCVRRTETRGVPGHTFTRTYLLCVPPRDAGAPSRGRACDVGRGGSAASGTWAALALLGLCAVVRRRA